MSEKVITLSDFSGGLNTTVDENRLPANQSADLRNVEVLDSKSIRRRSGYVRVTSTPMRDDSVFAITRQYRATGTEAWVSRCGTGVFYATDAAITVNELVQAEELGSFTTTPFAGYSGGAAVVCATPTALSVPYSDYVRVAVYGAASAKVDAGSYVSVTGSSVTFSALTATTHTVTIKPTATRNAKAMSLTFNGTGAVVVCPTVAASATHSVPVTSTGSRLRIRFHDPYTTSKKPIIYVGLGRYTYDTNYGSSTDRAKDIYIKAAGDYYYDQDGSIVGTRSLGWHNVIAVTQLWRPEDTRFGADFWLDGTMVGQFTKSDATLSAASRLALKVYARGAGYSGTVEVDDYEINAVLVDDFEAVTSWSSVQKAATASRGTSTTTYYTGAVPCYIDTVEYRATSSYARFAGLSASSDDFAAAAFNNYIYFASPHTALRRYDGSSVTAVTASGAAPPAKFLVAWKRRLWAAGKSSDASLLEYTAVDSAQDWTGGDATRVGQKDAGCECTGLAVWNDILWWFSPSKLFGITSAGDGTFPVKEVSHKYGCIAPNSLVVGGDALIFLSADGVRGYGTIPGVNDEDGSGFLWLSENITPTIGRINPDALDRVCAAFYGNRYYLSVPLDDATDNSHTLVYRMAEDGVPASWTLYDYGVTCFCVPRGDENALYGGTTDGHVLQLEVGTTDDGAEIEMFYRTPPITADGFASIKHYRRLYVAADSSALQSLTITPYTDDEAGSPITVQIDATTGAAPVRRPMNARGRSLGLEFLSSGSDQDLTISEVSLTFVPPRMR